VTERGKRDGERQERRREVRVTERGKRDGVRQERRRVTGETNRDKRDGEWQERRRGVRETERAKRDEDRQEMQSAFFHNKVLLLAQRKFRHYQDFLYLYVDRSVSQFHQRKTSNVSCNIVCIHVCRHRPVCRMLYF
jgi:hypothetical protein